MAVTPLPALDRTAATFKADTDAFFGTLLPTFTTEVNAQATTMTSQVTAASGSATAAATSATNAATSETNALASKNAAATSATASGGSATAAATSATNAATSETNALTSKSAAATSATNAANSATAAANSAASISSGPVTSVNGHTGVVTLNGSDLPALLPAYAGNALKVLSLNSGATGVVWTSFPDVPAVAAASNITPADSATNISTPSFTGSAYYSLYGKTQASRQARMSLNSDFSTILWDSGEVVGASTDVVGPSLDGLAPTSTLVYWQIRYKDVDGSWSVWSTSTSFTTAAQYVPSVAGAAYGGGFYAGRMKIGADSYALIVAPKASGESASLAAKTSNTTTTGTTSTWDGAANTAAMIAAGAAAHPAANFCKGLNIGGYTDWVLPAKDQLELLYRQLKPSTAANDTTTGANPNSDPAGANYTAGSPAQTAIAAFKAGGAEAFATDTFYWTSTEYSITYDWSQFFSSGLQGSGTKNATCRVRAVRMVKI